MLSGATWVFATVVFTSSLIVVLIHTEWRKRLIGKQVSRTNQPRRFQVSFITYGLGAVLAFYLSAIESENAIIHSLAAVQQFMVVCFTIGLPYLIISELLTHWIFRNMRKK
jgi:hypothetical protein